MKESIRSLTTKLEASLPDLEQRRSLNAFTNDVFEAVVYWRDLGRWVLENNTKINYPERAQSELRLHAKLTEMLPSKSTDEQQLCSKVLAVGGTLLELVAGVQPSAEGHLGVLKVLRERFRFLSEEYRFPIVDEQPTGIRFSSGTVFVKLEYATTPSLSCSFGQETDPEQVYWIDDLLFMQGDKRYESLPQQLELRTEHDVDEWFTFLSGVFRAYGREILSDKQGIFDQLAKAQQERDREYTQRMDALFGREQDR